MLEIRKIKRVVLLCIILLIGVACNSSKEQFIYLSEDYGQFPYDILKPDYCYKLAPRLQEISGLTYRSSSSLLCVNDEEGVVFDFNIKSGEIAGVYSFAKAGDYEGIEWIDSILYVLRSNGDIYEVKDFKSPDIKVKLYKTKLKPSNDTEGLGYDKVNNSLLVACKGKPAKKKKYKGNRAIYRFSLDTYQLSEDPAYLISQKRIGEILSFSDYDKISSGILEKVNPEKGSATFQPSAVAIHPITGNLYVLASVGKMLLVLNPQGDILAIVKLKRTNFNQPEGICFAPDGTMFISNEGRVNEADILRFNYQKQ